MITVYGIANCDTMKKARRWLETNSINYIFHDYKKQGIDEKQLRQWVKQVGWETLLNRRGMMWRKLDESVKEHINESLAIQVMLDTPSIIKRPVLIKDGKVQFVGFKESEYQTLAN